MNEPILLRTIAENHALATDTVVEAIGMDRTTTRTVAITPQATLIVATSENGSPSRVG
jgi:hypothetical protein